jgi:hypothetical protein
MINQTIRPLVLKFQSYRVSRRIASGISQDSRMIVPRHGDMLKSVA